jgi:CubicO group peptidase (beta-lactamase class C family)
MGAFDRALQSEGDFSELTGCHCGPTRYRGSRQESRRYGESTSGGTRPRPYMIDMVHVASIRRRLLVLIVAAGLLAGAPLRAADNLVLARFADYLESLRIQTGVPALVAVMTGTNDIAWERGFGYQDVERLLNARSDTPFHFDGLTQTTTAALVLRYAEEGRINLDDPLERYVPGSPEGTTTIRQILSHTSPDGTYAYRPQRFNLLGPIIEWCAGYALRGRYSKLFNQFAMSDSVPGADVVELAASPDGIVQSDLARYPSVLARLAVPYAVDSRGRASQSQYPARTLRGSSGLIASARDYAKFDLGLRSFVVLNPSTLALAWSAPTGRDGRPLPHGLGWFVQNYNGEKIVWQFGQGDNASSSLVIVVPGRGMALVLAANSDGLAKGVGLENGDLTNSPFGKLFLGLFVR